MKQISILLLLMSLICCENEPSVTERLKRVETKELILLDQNGKSYELRVDDSGNVKAIQVN
ncbi:MAG: hypothetical protein J0L69_07625 [Bacteroidetes bacterium]|nr:hypothetical protein [Bacteroidota bacterium]